MFVDRGLPAPLSLLQKLASLATKVLQESVEPLQEAHGSHWLGPRTRYRRPEETLLDGGLRNV
ncbi:putative dioxygenase [Venturia inaequalis]|nr:putative dioxygenase [Venturia inaequalis]